MSLASWLRGDSAQTIASGTKRKQEECSDSKTPKRQFRKNHSQSSYDWYEKNENGLWHCTLCRTSKFDNPYARGHEIHVPAKTTNHYRHASCKYKHVCLNQLYFSTNLTYSSTKRYTRLMLYHNFYIRLDFLIHDRLCLCACSLVFTVIQMMWLIVFINSPVNYGK